jgi:hypothetical protein
MNRARHLSMSLMSFIAALFLTIEGRADEATPETFGAKTSCNEDESVFEVTDLGSNRYIFYQRVRIHASIDIVWAEIRDAERLAAIALPYALPTFMWVDGGGPEIIPSRFQFTVGDATLLEEAMYRSDAHHQIIYRLVNPAFGMQQYYAAANLTQVCGQETALEYARYIELEPGVAVEGLEQVAEQEFIDIQAYFNGGS